MIDNKENNKNDLDKIFEFEGINLDEKEEIEKEITGRLQKENIKLDEAEIKEITRELKKVSKELDEILKRRNKLLEEIGEKSDDYTDVNEELKEKWDEIKEYYKEILAYEKQISQIKKADTFIDKAKNLYERGKIELKVRNINKELKDKHGEAGEILYSDSNYERIDDRYILKLIEKVKECDKEIEELSKKSSKLKEKINEVPQKKKYEKIAEEKISKITKEFEKITDNPALSENEKIKKIIHHTALICAVVAIQPIPFADIWILSPIQIVMIMWIGKVIGFKLNENGIRAFLGAGGLTIGGGIAAQNLIISLYKIGVPFLGGFTTIPFVYGATTVIGYSVKKYLEGIKKEAELIGKEITEIEKKYVENDRRILEKEIERNSALEEKEEIKNALKILQGQLQKEKVDKTQLGEREKELKNKLEQTENDLIGLNGKLDESAKREENLKKELVEKDKEISNLENKTKKFGIEDERIKTIKEKADKFEELEEIFPRRDIEAAEKRIEKRDYLGAAFVVAAIFEKTLQELYREKIKGERKDISNAPNYMEVKIKELYAQKIIDEKYYIKFDKTREMRNRALKPLIKQPLSPNEVKKFIENVKEIVKYAEEKLKEPIEKTQKTKLGNPVISPDIAEKLLSK